MGANQSLIRNIFLTEGALIALCGTLLGLVLGGVFCWLQQQYGIISMGMETSVTEGYPIKVNPIDFLYTMLVVSVITILTSYRPAVLAARSPAVQNL
jgi:lipoprotein-releasing system permease protein